jgi:GTP-binding protein
MPFYDRAKIIVKAGDGGAGSASMRREKYVARGGPDGGDGGRGGHVFLRANPELNTLLPFYYRRHFAAGNGGAGHHRKQHGANGADIYVDVPPGTQVRIISTDPLETDRITVTEADLTQPGQVLRVARGGKGGLGNVHFATSTHQAPRIAEKGEPGDERTLELELKIIADVGLVGYPNAGKSTLLSAASAARPEIADYPFTTLEPVLGVVSVDEDDVFVMADIPGLIEGASEGKGLGLEFLRHVERCRLLIHVLDGAAGLYPGIPADDAATRPIDGAGTSPIHNFEQINLELAQYSPLLAEKPQIVAVNKMDIPEARQRWPKIKAALAARGVSAYAISAATGEGVPELLRRVAADLRELPPALPLVETPAEADEDQPTHRYDDRSDERNFTVKQLEPALYRVYGPHIERVANMTNMDNPEALERLQRVLEKSGITRARETAGVQPGDTVVIGLTELQWTDEPWVADAKARARRASRHTGPGKKHS